MTELERYRRDRASVMAMVKFILIVAIAVALCYCGIKVIAVLVPFLVGFLLAKTSYAFANILTKNSREKESNKLRKRRLAIVIYIILLIVITIFVVWSTLLLLAQLNSMIVSVSNMATSVNINELMTTTIDRFSRDNGGFITPAMESAIYESGSAMWNNIVVAIPSFVSTVLSALWNMVGNIPYGIFVVISVILSGYYFINDGPNVLKFFIKNIPNRSFRKKTLTLLNDLFVMIFRVLGGYLLLLIITAVEAWIAFELAGVKYAVILAIITGIIDFLPVLGISATMIPVMVYCGLHGDFKAVLILIIAMSIMTVVRRLIEPPILGKSMHMHPLLMLISMALGVYIWGAVGFLLGPTVMIIITQMFKVFELDKKFMTFLSGVLGKAMKSPEETA